MSLVHIDVSPKQLSKLRNGHRVRIKPAMKGEGFNLLVDAIRYRPIMKSFSKGKAMEIQLSPEEILQNRQLTPEFHSNIKKENEQMSGRGIFGKTFDRFVEKTIGKKAKDVIYNTADLLKPKLKEGIDKIAEYAPELATGALSGLALATGQPELIPLAGIAGNQLGKMIGKRGADLAKNYLDDPTKYQDNVSNFVSNVGGSKANRASTLAGQVAQDELLNQLNQQLGTNMGSLSRANIATAIANRATAQMMPVPVQPKSFNEMPDSYSRSQENKDLFRGYGLRRNRAIVGTGGGRLPGQVPALQSQPAGANFQFGSTLPPAYQKYHKGIGSGLYL